MDALLRDLETTRERGCAVDDEQNTEGVTASAWSCPAAAIRRPPVSATMLTARVTTPLRETLVGDCGISSISLPS